MTNNATLRVFFAIELPLEIKEAIDKNIISPLKKKFPTKMLRWTKPDHLHITLQFLAALKPNDVETLIDHVNSCLKTVKTFYLIFGDVELFPSQYQPHVISLAVGPNDWLADLSNQIGGAISALKYPIEKRPFRGHLTLGRFAQKNVKQVTLPPQILPSVEKIPVKAITLFKSEPTQAGSKYISLAKISLGLPH